MTKCACGGELAIRPCKEDDGVIIHETYCVKCNKIHDRQFAGFPDIHFKHPCLYPMDHKECPFYFNGMCGAHSTYPEGYEYPKHDFACVYDIPKPKPKPEPVKMGLLR